MATGSLNDAGKEAAARVYIGAILAATGVMLIGVGTSWSIFASVGFGFVAFGLVVLLWVILHPIDYEPDIAEARRAERKLCWEEINAHIKTGPLTAIPHAERNGMVMACNIIFPKHGEFST